MSVYIKGFPIPNNCGACPLRLAWCRERIYMVDRPAHCPLIPVPEHGRLIDADAMRESLADLMKFPSNLVNGQWIVNSIREQPTIIPADDVIISALSKMEEKEEE